MTPGPHYESDRTGELPGLVGRTDRNGQVAPVRKISKKEFMRSLLWIDIDKKIEFSYAFRARAHFNTRPIRILRELS